LGINVQGSLFVDVDGDGDAFGTGLEPCLERERERERGWESDKMRKWDETWGFFFFGRGGGGLEWNDIVLVLKT